ncbi:hypothetical protein [Planktothrix prolifica]|uniref:hypothetical protein n=1 Tax=Planktothrix prolifica TaxID=54307 RepID=UPI0004158B54|nr:hypothetical protein [Planktothrix prolifica]
MFSNQNTFELNLSNLENKIKAYEEEIVQLKQQLEQTQSQLESWWLRCKIHRIPFMEISQVKKAKRQDWEKTYLDLDYQLLKKESYGIQKLWNLRDGY